MKLDSVMAMGLKRQQRVYFSHNYSDYIKVWIHHLVFFFYAPEGTSGGILKSHRPSVRPSVTNRVSAISHKLLKQIQ